MEGVVIKRQGFRRQADPCTHPLDRGRLECSQTLRVHHPCLELLIEGGCLRPLAIRNQISRSLGRSQSSVRAHRRDQDQFGYRGDIDRIGLNRPDSKSVLMDFAALGLTDDRPGLCRFELPRDGVSVAQTIAIQPIGNLSRCITSDVIAEIVLMMEDLIITYLRIISSGPRYPVILIVEEISKNFSDVRKRETARHGESAPLEYDYERKEVCLRLVPCEPFRVRRLVTVNQRRTRKDIHHLIRDLVDRNFSRGENVHFENDNVNTNVGASRYDDFQRGEARPTFDRIDYKDYPKYEYRRIFEEKEIRIPARVFFDGLIQSRSGIAERLAIRVKDRHICMIRINSTFTAADSRRKHCKLSSSIEDRRPRAYLYIYL
jgi:hypothetical protein